MDRSIDSDYRDPEEKDSASDNSGHERGMSPHSDDMSQLQDRIDGAIHNRPSMSQFFDRLEQAGVRPVPGFQKSGRLNGMSYEFNGIRYRGSDLGRSYTASGLEKMGVHYDPAKDQLRLQESARRANEHPARAFDRPVSLRERSMRVREYDALNDSERTALREVGRFRTISADDFVAVQYHGNRDRWVQDVAKLTAQNLLEIRSVVIASHDRDHRTHTKSFTVMALTKQGKDLLKRFDRQSRESRQALYSGFVKPREIAHDAAIYRMFQAESAHIERQGGRIRRIVLDFELKKKAYAPLAKARAISHQEFQKKQATVAQENGLHVVDGKIRLPDLRIEYETANGEAARVDLELATEHYRADHMSAKEKAGFKIYADARSLRPGGTSGRSSVLDDHEIEIFSF